ncbi:phosphate ABC transporter ATP-binding protein [Oscillospiraceae bacterium LTW-04]|nr:phosphate ABC transporter ATP-binding protein [Oscillospiraceae bacterium MB24-C1]
MGLLIDTLSLWRGERQILKDVYLHFSPSSATALLGPSGCGKSTLLKAINRLHEQENDLRVSGSVRLYGKELLGSRVNLPDVRRQVGMVFQTPTPFPMSIAQNVAYGIRLHERLHEDDLNARVRNALKRAALWNEVADRLDQSALSLSGGQQQRLCIARALAVGPRVLLLDEPTSALDPLSTHKIEQLIIQLKREIIVVLVTHNPTQALRCCNDAAVLINGQVCEQGRVEQVISAPRSKEAQQFLQQRT